MIVQDVNPLSTFNPHGGPITHSSTGSKPGSPVHPLFPKLFPPRGLVCSSRTTVLVIYSGNKRNTQSRCSGPLSRVVSDIERLPIHLKLLMVPAYLTLDVFYMFNSRDNLMFIHGLSPDCSPHKHSIVVKLPLTYS